jgi:hypothetical protein
MIYRIFDMPGQVNLTVDNIEHIEKLGHGLTNKLPELRRMLLNRVCPQFIFSLTHCVARRHGAVI